MLEDTRRWSSDLKESIIATIEESIATKQLLKSEAETIAKSAEVIISALKHGGKLVLFGNGGSAADAQHIAAEFVGKYLLERKPYPAIALTTNSSAVTAIANDMGYDHVFERQVNALCSSNDAVIGISTSGKSRSVILGIEAAKLKRTVTIGMTGKPPNLLAEVADIAICVPSRSTPRIQESHILVGHILSELVEKAVTDEA